MLRPDSSGTLPEPYCDAPPRFPTLAYRNIASAQRSFTTRRLFRLHELELGLDHLLAVRLLHLVLLLLRLRRAVLHHPPAVAHLNPLDVRSGRVPSGGRRDLESGGDHGVRCLGGLGDALGR